VVQVAYQSIGGSPWSDETERSLDALKATIDAAIASDPILTEVFDRRHSILIERDNELIPF
jgi:hypothetical protein